MGFSEYLAETNFARIINILRGDVPSVQSVGIMTAHNPMSIKTSAAENNKRNKEFLTSLRRAHFKGLKVGPIDIMGKYGNIEDGYLIPHINRESMIEYAARYGQKAVIWGEKNEDEDGHFMRFEWIETSQNEEPVNPFTYSTVQTRDVVVTGSGVIDRKDYFSAKPFPKSEIDKRTGKPASIRKFAIPFFEPEYENREEISQEEIYPDISFVESELPNTPEVQELIEEIRRKGVELNMEGRVPKWYWQTRGSLGASVEKLRILLDG